MAQPVAIAAHVDEVTVVEQQIDQGPTPKIAAEGLALFSSKGLFEVGTVVAVP